MLKPIARTLASLRAWPLVCGYRLCCALMGQSRAFIAASERVARIPGFWGVYVRAAFYRRVLAFVGDDVYFGFMSVLSKPQARIGHRVYIGRFCTLGLVDIADDVMLADAVQVLSGRHQHGSGAHNGQVMRDNEQVYEPVSIGRGAWLGASAVVMADVGAGAVVAAGAVVVKPVTAGDKVGGVPAVSLQRPAALVER